MLRPSPNLRPPGILAFRGDALAGLRHVLMPVVRGFDVDRVAVTRHDILEVRRATLHVHIFAAFGRNDLRERPLTDAP